MKSIKLIILAAWFLIIMSSTGFASLEDSIGVLQSFGLLEYGHLEDAERYLKPYVEKNTSDVAFQTMGVVYFQQRRYEESIKMFEAATKLKPNTQVYLNLGNNYLMLNDFLKAEEYYTKGMESAGNDELSISSANDALLSLYVTKGDVNAAKNFSRNKRRLGAFTTKTKSGIGVVGVLKNGPASMSGIKVGDTIVKFKGVNLENVQHSEFRKMIRELDIAEVYELAISRSGKMINVEVFSEVGNRKSDGKVDVLEDNSSRFKELYSKAQSPAIIKFKGVQVKMHFATDTYYIIDKPDSPKSIKRKGMFQLLTEYNGKRLVKNKYIKLKGETYEVEYSSENNDIVSPVNPKDSYLAEPGEFYIWKEGEAIVKIKIQDVEVEIPINIVKVPVARTMDQDEIIKILGVPDYTNTKFIQWPEGKIIGGIYYSPDDPSGMSVTHWKYDIYNDAIFEFGGGFNPTLSRIVSLEWNKLFWKKYE